MTHNLVIDIQDWNVLGFFYKNKPYSIFQYKDILLDSEDWDSFNNVLSWCSSFMVKTETYKDSNGKQVKKYGSPWYQYHVDDSFKTILLTASEYKRWEIILKNKYSTNINGGKT